jgi:molybdopterin/thiamine biosynthesis adenylyltransferase
MAEGTVLSGEEIERYARHIVLPEIGGAGQQRIKASRVCIIGAGGLGSPVALYLAAAGVGRLGIVDDDVVSLSNLQRQIIHATDQISNKKTGSAKSTITRINPHVEVIAHEERLDDKNAKHIFEQYDIIVDGSDNFTTRYLVADQAEASRIPLVAAALGRFDGSLTVLAPYKDNNPRYRDIFPEAPPAGSVPTCAEAGVLGAVAGVMGTLQATEVIKLITQIGTPLIGQILLYDALECRFEKMRYKRKT